MVSSSSCSASISALSISLGSTLDSSSATSRGISSMHMISSRFRTKMRAVAFTMTASMEVVSMRKVIPTSLVIFQIIIFGQSTTMTLMSFQMRGIPATLSLTRSNSFQSCTALALCLSAHSGTAYSIQGSALDGTLQRVLIMPKTCHRSPMTAIMKRKQQSPRQRKLSRPYSPGSMRVPSLSLSSGKMDFMESRANIRAAHWPQP
mmetsp:Transcript_59829/g.175537  ORF Transcript_59829/g.175537 Transcript_59829/m.175537 type:complete len:205 (-) Transcript_59829:671-1285(-)